MRRRAIIALIGGAAICRPLAARRQARDRVLMIGWLNVLAEDAPEPRLRIEVFRQRTGSKGAPFALSAVRPQATMPAAELVTLSTGCDPDFRQRCREIAP